jgi:hypothetical protein
MSSLLRKWPGSTRVCTGYRAGYNYDNDGYSCSWTGHQYHLKTDNQYDLNAIKAENEGTYVKGPSLK